MTQDAAEAIAAKALLWLTTDDDLLGVFLGTTGATQADVRAQIGDAGFLASVLDFLVMDDQWVIRFCEAEGLAYDMPMQARAALPGGQEMHWT